MEALSVFLLCALTVCIAIVVAAAARIRTKRQSWESDLVSTFVIFGSGGHTGEMLQLIKELDMNKYSPLYFVLGHSDTTSRRKIEKFNQRYLSETEWLTIHRSREVKQSFVTSIFSTMIALKDAVCLLLSKRPQLIICNGPDGFVVHWPELAQKYERAEYIGQLC